MTGPLESTPGRIPYANMPHPRVRTCSVIRSSIFQDGLLAREDVRTPPDMGPHDGLEVNKSVTYSIGVD